MLLNHFESSEHHSRMMGNHLEASLVLISVGVYYHFYKFDAAEVKPEIGRLGFIVKNAEFPT